MHIGICKSSLNKDFIVLFPQIPFNINILIGFFRIELKTEKTLKTKKQKYKEQKPHASVLYKLEYEMIN